MAQTGTTTETTRFFWECGYHDKAGGSDSPGRRNAGGQRHFRAALKRGDAYYCEMLHGYHTYTKIGSRTMSIINENGQIVWER